MAKVGLIAGGGSLPVEFVRSARQSGDTVVAFAIRGMASSRLEEEADKIYWMDIGEYRKFAFLLIKERIRHLALIGTVNKSLIYESGTYDKEAREGLKSLQNKKDYSILGEITRHLGRMGVEVIDGMKYLSHLLPEKGVLSRTAADARVEEDINFGYDVAKKLAGMDIGQTVVVKGGAVVAVEAMEGTDETIVRAKKTAGEGCVMVKVSRPKQDMRWDVPTVGPATMEKLIENKFSAIAIENAKMFLIEKEKFLSLADSGNIVVKVV
ncbi:LpxI family protein [Candidatus Omnitrophota bacterium]